MRKNFKNVIALVLAIMVMMVSMSVAFAADPTYKITVTPSGSGVSIDGKDFKAYKLFDATYADTSSPADGKNDAFAYSIRTDNYFYVNALSVLQQYFTFRDTSDANIKTVLVKDDVDFDVKAAYELTDKLDAISNLFANATADGTGTASGDKAEITVPVAGYYLVTGEGVAVDSEGNARVPEEKVMASIALTTTQPTATIKAKLDAPDIDKVITSNQLINATNGEAKENNAAVGDTVDYKVTSKVPYMTGYNEKFYFMMTDTLSKGLTLIDADTSDPADNIPDGIVVKIGDTTLTRVADQADATAKAADATNPVTTTYFVEKDAADASGNQVFRIIFHDFLQYKGTYNTETDTWTGGVEGTAITVTYSALLNDEAVIGDAGNPNDIKLTYSNNPNEEYDGDNKPNDKPSEKDKTGKTPDHRVKTYVTGIELTKVDGNSAIKDNSTGEITGYTKTLQNVTFTVEGEKLNDITETTFSRYVEVAPVTEGGTTTYPGATYYLLTDGTYTEDAPITSCDDKNSSSYVGGDNAVAKYKLVSGTEFHKGETERVSYTFNTDSNGVISVTGLSKGTYTITEIRTLAGYNLLKDAITITVDYDTNTDGSFKNWKVLNGTTPLTADGTSKLFKFNVENFTGVELPSTGGIGTTIFYVAGSLMVLAAAILLITKRRMGAND